MTLANDIELENTRRKLRELELHFEARTRESADNGHVHELSLRSLKRLINQLKEEIALYEVHQPADRRG